MDEYLFIQWAKLQADRRRLQREQLAALQAQQATAPERAEVREPVPARGLMRALPSIFNWRAQS